MQLIAGCRLVNNMRRSEEEIMSICLLTEGEKEVMTLGA
jgi:hypothetical protein